MALYNHGLLIALLLLLNKTKINKQIGHDFCHTKRSFYNKILPLFTAIEALRAKGAVRSAKQ